MEDELDNIEQILFELDSYNNISFQNHTNHATEIYNTADKQEAANADIVILHAILHSQKFKRIRTYIEQVLHAELFKEHQNLVQLYQQSSKPTQTALLSCLAQQISFVCLNSMNYIVTRNQFQYAQASARREEFGIQGEVKVVPESKLGLTVREFLQIRRVLSSYCSISFLNQKIPDPPLKDSQFIQYDVETIIIIEFQEDEQDEECIKGKRLDNHININEILYFNGMRYNLFSPKKELYTRAVTQQGIACSYDFFRRMTWNIMRPSCRADECEQCVRLDFLKIKQKFWKLTEAEVKEIEILDEHKRQAAIQYDAYKYSISNVAAGMIVFVLDFGENFHISYQHVATGETHFDHVNVTFLNIVAFTNRLGLIDCQSFNFLSLTDNKDTQQVVESLKQLIEKQLFVGISKVVFISDCGPHFRSKEFIQFIFGSLTIPFSKLEIHFILFVERHGKSICDRNIGESKRLLKAFLPATGIETIEDLKKQLEHSTRSCKIKKRFFIKVDQENYHESSINYVSVRSNLYYLRSAEGTPVYASPLYNSLVSYRIQLDITPVVKSPSARIHAVQKPSKTNTVITSTMMKTINYRRNSQMIQDQDTEKQKRTTNKIDKDNDDVYETDMGENEIQNDWIEQQNEKMSEFDQNESESEESEDYSQDNIDQYSNKITQMIKSSRKEYKRPIHSKKYMEDETEMPDNKNIRNAMKKK